MFLSFLCFFAFSSFLSGYLVEEIEIIYSLQNFVFNRYFVAFMCEMLGNKNFLCE